MTAPTMNPAVAPQLSRRKRMELLVTQLDQERSTHWSHWQQINSVMFPRRGRFFITDENRGDRRNKSIIDSTATFAARNASAGMMTGTTNPARDWFLLTTQDPDLAERSNVKEWLYLTAERMRAILLQSNFYDVMHAADGDMLVYGTSPFLMEEDDEDVVRFEEFPIGSYWLAIDHKRRVTTFARECSMTVEQIVTWFGYEKCSTAVRDAWTNGVLGARFAIVHVIAPNEQYDARRMTSKYKKFYSCYYEKANGDDRFLRESGYDEFPVLTCRWSVTGQDVYGTDCPGMTALGDVLQLQFGEKKSMQALDKLVNPPLAAPGSLFNKVINQLPGGVTYDDGVSQGHGIRALHEVRPDFGKLEAKQEQVRGRIERAFYADIFQMTTYLAEIEGKQPRTAAEIAVREQEKLSALGPVLQRLNKDVYDPLINRLFNMMVRRGDLPPVPPELEGQDLKVEYISILHTAQKATGLAGMERFIAAAGAVALAKAQDTTGTMDVVNTDEYLDEHGKASGIPPRLIRSADEVAKMRDDRAKAMQQQQQAQTLKDASQGAKNLSETDTQGDNALTALAGAAA